jgi:hypothetical protein
VNISPVALTDLVGHQAPSSFVDLSQMGLVLGVNDPQPAPPGLANALGGNPYGPVTVEAQHAVGDAVDVLGASEVLGDMTAVLYGDAAAAALGWAPVGIAEHGA